MSRSFEGSCLRMSPMRTVVHLSDLHFGRVDSGSCRRCCRRSGPSRGCDRGIRDSRSARRSQFVQARAFLQQLPFPQLIVPGNHDIPLFNLPARLLNPLAGYRRYITSDLMPVFADEEMLVVGLNSARSVPFSGSGRLNEAQVRVAAARLAAAAPQIVKIIVTHHPFDLPDGRGDEHLIGRSRMAMEQLAQAGADLFLAGHLHVSHVGGTAERYKIAGHFSAGGAGRHHVHAIRGEPNAFNVVRLARPNITVDADLGR